MAAWRLNKTSSVVKKIFISDLFELKTALLKRNHNISVSSSSSSSSINFTKKLFFKNSRNENNPRVIKLNVFS